MTEVVPGITRARRGSVSPVTIAGLERHGVPRLEFMEPGILEGGPVNR